jgi:hypothetical protein
VNRGANSCSWEAEAACETERHGHDDSRRGTTDGQANVRSEKPRQHRQPELDGPYLPVSPLPAFPARRSEGGRRLPVDTLGVADSTFTCHLFQVFPLVALRHWHCCSPRSLASNLRLLLQSSMYFSLSLVRVPPRTRASKSQVQASPVQVCSALQAHSDATLWHGANGMPGHDTGDPQRGEAPEGSGAWMAISRIIMMIAAWPIATAL